MSAERHFHVAISHVKLRPDVAARHFAIAAAAGHAHARANLGVMYDRGLGVPVDDARAAFHYAVAAEAGDASAAYNLAMCFFCGSGVAHDRASALVYFALAASQGDADARLAVDGLIGP